MRTSIIRLFAFLVLAEDVMPHHFEFDAEHKILLVVLKGHIDGPETIQIDREMRAEILRMAPMVGISDLSGVTSFDVPGDIIRNLARQKPAPFPAETPRFIVASSDLLFGMMRMYELAADRPDGKLTVVRRMEDVLASMGVQAAKFERLE